MAHEFQNFGREAPSLIITFIPSFMLDTLSRKKKDYIKTALILKAATQMAPGDGNPGYHKLCFRFPTDSSDI